MSYDDIKPRVTINGDATLQAEIDAAMRALYEGSDKAAAAMRAWLAQYEPQYHITIEYVSIDNSKITTKFYYFPF